MQIFLLNRQFNKRRKLVRKLDKDSIESLKNDLSLMDWENIMNETDVDKSYDMFLDVFTERYDKHCPLKKVNVTKGIREGKPWFTNGLRNACKKKNTSYKNFLRNRTQSAQVKYKTYKNKLTTILRVSEKQYYNKLLAQEKII